MPGEVTIGAGFLLGFLGCLARVGGLLLFLPLPGLKNAPSAPRIVLVLAITICLRPVWPAPPAGAMSAIAVAGWALAQSAAGLGAGLAFSLLQDGLLLAAQVLGLQAGYSYASTVDPMSQADSGILQVWMQLLVGFLLFAIGMDRHIIRAFAAGMTGPAPVPSMTPIQAVAELGTSMFVTAVRLAFPVVAVLLLVDLALAMTGRIHSQLQLLSLAFPAKMAGAVLLLAMITAAFPSVFEAAATRTIRLLPSLAGF